MFRPHTRWQKPKTPRRLTFEQLEDRTVPSTPGGTTTAVGDLDGDGFPDLITAGGPGLGAVVHAYSGKTGNSILPGGAFNPYPGENFTTIGLYVAAGDVDSDGQDELFVSPDQGGGARVQVFSLVNGRFTLRANFFAIDDANFRGGARIATGDVDGDGRDDLIAGAGFSGGPRIAVYNGRWLAGDTAAPPKLLGDFYAFEPTLRDGVYAALGDLTGDSKADFIFGGGPGGGPRVLAVDAARMLAGDGVGAFSQPVANFFAFDPNLRNGVAVAAGNLDADARLEILAAEGPGGGAAVNTFEPDGMPIRSYMTGFHGGTGLRVAAGDLSGDGLAEVIASPASDNDRTVRGFVTSGTVYFSLQNPFDTSATIPPAAPATPSLTITLDALTVSEAAGGLAATLTITRSGGNNSAPAVVQVSNSNPADATAPATVVIPSAGTSAQAIVSVTDNAIVDGSRTVTFTATATGYSPVSIALTITDDEPPITDSAGMLAWNDVLLTAVRTDASAPPVATRAMALLNVALYDVQAGFTGKSGYAVTLPPQSGADVAAAIASAGHRVLSELFPAQQSTFDAQRAGQLAAIPSGAARNAGVAYGVAVADAVLAARADDGNDAFVDYTPGTDVGDWEPTPPMYAEELLPQWAAVRPFALASPSEFRPDAPPAVGSASWLTAYNEVRSLGAADSVSRTAADTALARLWADGSGTATPAGRWLQIALAAARDRGSDPATVARLLATLSVAFADTSVAAWDAKYTYGTWRPVTAVREADRFGLTPDADWTPLLVTPNHPEYVSGHSTYSRAAATVLEQFFGNAYAFTTSTVFQGTTLSKTYASFNAAANDAGLSRILGGIHFPFSNAAGQSLGLAVAGRVLESFDRLNDVDAPQVAFSAISGQGQNTATIRGRVNDGQTGVQSLVAGVEGQGTVGVTLDAAGNFAFTPASLADGTYTVRFIATDRAGNQSATDFQLVLDRVMPTVTISAPAAPVGGAADLTGTVNGTGSAIIALSYQLDEAGSPIVPVAFASDGSFSVPLDLSRATPGGRTVTVSARDAAGNVRAVARSFTLTARTPLAVASVLPADGATDVGVTYRPRVAFTRPVVGVSSANIRAVDAAGHAINTRPVLSDDGTFAWVFFPDGLPGGSAVTLVIDGNGNDADPNDDIRGAADNAVLAGTRTVSFTTVGTTIGPALNVWAYDAGGVLGVPTAIRTTITGIVADPGPDLKPNTPDDVQAGPDGILMTADDVYRLPLRGVQVFALGRENQVVTTDANGAFTLDVPAGTVKLVFDGRTATNAPAGFFFPEMVMDVVVEPGVANTVMGGMGTLDQQAAGEDVRGVFLPRLTTGMLQAVGTGVATVTATAAAAPDLTPAERAGLSLTIPSGTTRFDETGQITAGTQIGISTVPEELVRDMLPPGVLQHTFDLTIQAPGVSTFGTPLTLTVPNVFGAAPGTKLNFLSFDHTTGRLEIEGTATVSADGKTVTTDPGTGVTHPGWHGVNSPGGRYRYDPGDICTTPSAGERVWAGLGAIGSFMDELVGLTNNFVDIVNLSAGTERIPVTAPLDAVFSVRTLIKSFDTIEDPTKSQAEKNKARVELDYLVFDKLKVSSPETNALKLAMSVQGFKEGFDKIPGLQVDFAAAVFGVPVCVPDKQARADAILNQVLPQLAQQLPAKAAAQAQGLHALDQILHQLAEPIGHIDVTQINSGLTPQEIAQIDLLLQQYENEVNAIDSAGSVAQDIPPLIAALEELAQAYSHPAEVAAAGTVHFSATYAGTAVRGRTDGGTPIDVNLPDNRFVRLTAYDPATNRLGITAFDTGASGGTNDRGHLVLVPDTGPDTDGDGISDRAEAVVGTNPNRKDTDGDGVTDLAELRAGTNPVGTRPAVTGVVGRVGLSGTAESVVAAGNLAYVATGGYGLSIVDVSDPTAPAVLGELDLPGFAYAVAADDVTPFVAVATGGELQLVDATDPRNPVVTATILGAFTTALAADGVVIAGSGGVLKAYDILTGEELASAPLGAPITGLARAGDFVYAMNFQGGLTVVNAANFDLIPHGSVTLTDGGANMVVANGLLYAAATTNSQGGYVTVDVSNPDAPVEISGSDVPPSTAAAGTAFSATGSGLGLLAGRTLAGVNALDVMDIRNATTTNAFLTRYEMPGAPTGIVASNGLALVSVGAAGLAVVSYLSVDSAGVPPTVSITAPTATGNVAIEGSAVPVRMVVSDDVEVRGVELLLNGAVVASDVTFPFDLTAIMPDIAVNGENTVTLQVRATDTGGNVGVSNVVTLTLTPDGTPPAVTAVMPADGSSVTVDFRTVRVTFSEALDPSTVTADTFRLTGPGGDVTPTAVRLVRRGTVVQLEYPRVALGDYQFVIRQADVHDRAGNPLGASDLVATLHALTLVDDDFDGENDGNFSANHTGFANWIVTRGSVDLQIAEGFFYVGHGTAVDMDGTTGEAGRLESRLAFNLSPGTYELTFWLGNTATDGQTNTMTVSLGAAFNETFSRTDNTGGQFQVVTRQFTVTSPTTASLAFDHDGGDFFGLLIDEVVLRKLP